MITIPPQKEDGCLIFTLPKKGRLESFTLRVQGYAQFSVELFVGETLISQQNEVKYRHGNVVYAPIDPWLYEHPISLENVSVRYKVHTSFPCDITAFASIVE